jgi:F0F1-type ATP synthase beta subunit
MSKSIDETFNKLARKNKEELENGKIKPIDTNFPFAQNGIWAMMGGMGKGKSYNYLKLIAKQEVMQENPFFETVVICSTSSEFDKNCHDI